MRGGFERGLNKTKLSHPTIIHHSIWYGSWDGERRKGLAWDLPSIQNRNILEWINLHWTSRLVSFSYSSQVSPLNSIDRLTSTVSYSNLRHLNYLLHSLSHLSSSFLPSLIQLCQLTCPSGCQFSLLFLHLRASFPIMDNSPSRWVSRWRWSLSTESTGGRKEEGGREGGWLICRPSLHLPPPFPPAMFSTMAAVAAIPIHSHSINQGRGKEGGREGMNWLSHPSSPPPTITQSSHIVRGVEKGKGGGRGGDKGRKLPLFTRCDLSPFPMLILSLTSPNSQSSKAIPTPITY